MIPNSAIASAFVAPPSTTAEAAATFCSYVYLACLPSMASGASLPNARYIYGLVRDAKGLGGRSVPMALPEELDRHPSRLDIVLPPEVSAHKKTTHFSMSKKWEAVHDSTRWSFSLGFSYTNLVRAI